MHNCTQDQGGIGGGQDNGNVPEHNTLDSSDRDNMPGSKPQTSIEISEPSTSKEKPCKVDHLISKLSTLDLASTSNEEPHQGDPHTSTLHIIILKIRDRKRSDLWPIYKLKKSHRPRSHMGNTPRVLQKRFPMKLRYPLLFPAAHRGTRSLDSLQRGHTLCRRRMQNKVSQIQIHDSLADP